MQPKFYLMFFLPKYLLVFFIFQFSHSFALAAPGDFITTWQTDLRSGDETGDNQVFINTTPGETEELKYDFNIDWGDGNSETNVVGDISHTYATPGTYQITISGKFPVISFTDQEELLSVDQWGDTQLRSLHGAFESCVNLTFNAADVPNLSNVTDMSRMFYKATNFNSDISSWDVSNITNMEEMFSRARSFNQPLDAWNTSKVTNMEGMFALTEAFNQPLDTWDVSNVISMDIMFAAARVFNQPLNMWDVSSVVSMSSMFRASDVFNQALNSWDVSSVTDMEDMFSLTDSFNQPLDAWDVGSVTTMRRMFFGADVFNQSLNAWNVSNVTTMENMFAVANSFDQPLGNWNIGNVTNMESFMSNSSISRGNYDKSLIGWSKLILQENVETSLFLVITPQVRLMKRGGT